MSSTVVAPTAIPALRHGEPLAGDRDKRRQVLDGARTVFLASGFDGASMGEIAKAAGVSKGTLYVYFDSKEKLFEALTLEEKRSQAETLSRLDLDDPDVRSVLWRFGVELIEVMSRPESIAAIRMVIGAADKFPSFGQAFHAAGPDMGCERVAAYLDAQAVAGRISATDTRVAARQFLDLCIATTLRRLLFRAAEPMSAAETARHVDDALSVFFAAYGPRADAQPLG